MSFKSQVVDAATNKSKTDHSKVRAYFDCRLGGLLGSRTGKALNDHSFDRTRNIRAQKLFICFRTWGCPKWSQLTGSSMLTCWVTYRFDRSARSSLWTSFILPEPSWTSVERNSGFPRKLPVWSSRWIGRVGWKAIAGALGPQSSWRSGMGLFSLTMSNLLWIWDIHIGLLYVLQSLTVHQLLIVTIMYATFSSADER